MDARLIRGRLCLSLRARRALRAIGVEARRTHGSRRWSYGAYDDRFDPLCLSTGKSRQDRKRTEERLPFVACAGYPVTMRMLEDMRLVRVKSQSRDCDRLHSLGATRRIVQQQQPFTSGQSPVLGL
eukprot:767978-Hanusia_phi.AAC.1